MRDLLLASSSRCHPHGYLDHLARPLQGWADGVDEVLFVPWARTDHDGYTDAVRERLAPLDLAVTGIQEHDDPGAAVERARAVFVGGGNTFLLLDTLQRSGVLPALRERVLTGGLRYLGTSAGSNVACPTIQTTNDMPVVWPAGGPGSLALVRLQVNAHFHDPDPTSTHRGETRYERLAEYHEHHAFPVVGLREHGWLRVRGDELVVHGTPDRETAPGVLLRPDQDPRDLPPGTDVSDVAT